MCTKITRQGWKLEQGFKELFSGTNNTDGRYLKNTLPNGQIRTRMAQHTSHRHRWMCDLKFHWIQKNSKSASNIFVIIRQCIHFNSICMHHQGSQTEQKSMRVSKSMRLAFLYVFLKKIIVLNASKWNIYRFLNWISDMQMKSKIFLLNLWFVEFR